MNDLFMPINETKVVDIEYQTFISMYLNAYSNVYAISKHVLRLKELLLHFL